MLPLQGEQSSCSNPRHRQDQVYRSTNMTNRRYVFAVTRRLPVGCAVGLFSFGSLGSSGAQAADTEEITISAPRAKTIGHDPATGASIQVVMQSAPLKIDPL